LGHAKGHGGFVLFLENPRIWEESKKKFGVVLFMLFCGEFGRREGKDKSINEIINCIIRKVGNWIFVDEAFQGLSTSSLARDWVTSISSSPLN